MEPMTHLPGRSPQDWHLDQMNLSSLTSALHERGWLAADDRLIYQEKAGEGNMNLVLRVKSTEGYQLILKQSRSWVEKYPEFDAPEDRICQEAKFYQLAGATVGDMLPIVAGFDRDRRMLVMEDLGQLSDLTSMYKGHKISESHLDDLVDFLVRLHRIELSENFENLAMRKLNYHHMFVVPLTKGSLALDDITPGLEKAATDLREDRSYVERVHEIGQKYLNGGNKLVHGDFYPGSWALKGDRVIIFDPEFAFRGNAAFDLGIMAAHFILSGFEDQGFDLIDQYLRSSVLAKEDVFDFAGVEIMRRLLGVAQLPLDLSLEQKVCLLNTSKSLIFAEKGVS